MDRFSEMIITISTVPLGWFIARSLRAFASVLMVLCCCIAMGADRPSSYFWEKSTASAPTPLTLQRLVDEEDDCDDASIDVTLDPVPEEVIEPREAPAAKAVYRPNLASVLRNAFEFYDEVPEGLGDQPPQGFQRIKMTGYTLPSCVNCPAVKQMLDADPRFDVHWVEGPCPFPLHQPEDGRPVGYPILKDDVTGYYYWDNHLASAEDLSWFVSNRRAKLGLTAGVMELPDYEVGTVTKEALRALATVESTNTKLTLEGFGPFGSKGWQLYLPQKASVKGSRQRDGSKFDFLDSKPTIKRSGLFHQAWNVNSASVDSRLTRLKLSLNWWQTISFRAKDY